MLKKHHFPLAALASSLITFSAQATPLSSHDAQLTAPDLMLVAQTCAPGYTMHPRLRRCVAQPACPEGASMHPRLHVCVTQPTCPEGSTMHPRLHVCVATQTQG
jgi:hypothetical protein